LKGLKNVIELVRTDMGDVGSGEELKEMMGREKEMIEREKEMEMKVEEVTRNAKEIGR